MAEGRNFKKLVELRKSLGISQSSLATQLGVTQAYISTIESGRRENTKLLDRAIEILKQELPPQEKMDEKKKRFSPIISQIQTHKAGTLNWAWLNFSGKRAGGDVCDMAAIDSRIFSILFADIVGSGLAGVWQAEQLRFGFHAVASTVSRFTNSPEAFIGPLGNALRTVKSKTSPPGLGIICLNTRAARIDFSVYGLPGPIILQNRRTDPNRSSKYELVRYQDAVLPADFLIKETEKNNRRSIDLGDGDTFLICTDGFFDWLRVSKRLNQMNIDQLFLEAAGNFHGSASAIIKAILSAGTVTQDYNTRDDAAILVVSREKR